jgi:hypothetical protein
MPPHFMPIRCLRVVDRVTSAQEATKDEPLPQYAEPLSNGHTGNLKTI